MQQFNNNINDGKAVIENEAQRASRMGCPALPCAQPCPKLPWRVETTASAHRKGKGNSNSPQADQNKVQIWANKGNRGKAAAEPQRVERDRQEQHPDRSTPEWGSGSL